MSTGSVTITVRDTPEGEAVCYYNGPPPTGSSLSPAQRLAFSVLCDLQEEGVELILKKAQVDRVVDGNVVQLIRKGDHDVPDPFRPLNFHEDNLRRW